MRTYEEIKEQYRKAAKERAGRERLALSKVERKKALVEYYRQEREQYRDILTYKAVHKWRDLTAKMNEAQKEVEAAKLEYSKIATETAGTAENQ